MDRQKILLLLSEYQHRELPPAYDLISPAAEVAALLKDQAAEKQAWKLALDKQQHEYDQMAADITQLAFLLDDAVARCETPLEAQGLKRIHRELRVLKDKLKYLLNERGYTWRNPLGELFEGELPELVSVDGWRHEPEYSEDRVTQVREPIILHHGNPIRTGSVVVSGPAES